MASSTPTKKPHAVLIAWPAQGHVVPLMRFAKLLYSRGFHITYVHTEFNYNRLIRSNGPQSVQGLPHFRYETIPDGTPPPSNPDATQNIPLVSESLRKNALVPFKKLLDKLNASPDIPPVSCVIGDNASSFAIRAAELLGIPGVKLYTPSTFSFIAYLFYNDLLERGIFPLNDDYLTDGTLDTEIELTDKIKMRLKDFPDFFRSTDPEDFMFHYLRFETWDCLKASALILNTFDELEQEAIEAIKTKYNYSNPIFPVGPLSLMEQKHVPENITKKVNPSLWKQDPKVFEWLDGREADSVLFVNYGSITVLSENQFQELVWGIANSKQPFLWIVRPDVVKDGSTAMSDEFLEETKERGFITTWCEQDKVLCHDAIGAFFTHCGWNSMSETISGGVPVLCWPWFAEQTTNCYYSCNSWGIGMEIDNEVNRDQVSRQIVEMMKGEKGKEMRRNAKEWKGKAERDTDVGGSSFHNLDKAIQFLVGHK